IIHYHIPGSPEMYLQEVGRVSRDGKKGLAILLYQAGDENIQRRFIESSLPSRENLATIHRQKSKQLSNDEPMMKLAQYFLATSVNMEEALRAVEARKEIKNKQLSFMLQYVYQNKCKRNYLLNYFGENQKENIKECCSSCGLDKEKIILEINEPENVYSKEKTRKNILPWQEVIKTLYKNLQEHTSELQSRF